MRDCGKRRESRSTHARRRSSIAIGAQEISRSKNDGIENHNRWSHSSLSSRSSLHNEKRNSFSLRVSLSASGDIMSPAQVQFHHQKSPFLHGSDVGAYPGSIPDRRPSTARPAHGMQWSMAELPPIETLPSLSQSVYDSDALSASTSNPTPSTGSTQHYPRSFSPPDHRTPVDFSRNPLQSPSRPNISRNATAPLSPLLSRRKSLHQHIRNDAHPSSQHAGPLRSPPYLPTESRKRSSHERRSGSRDKIHYGHHGHHRSISNSSNSYHYGIAGTTPPRTRERRERDKKVMLSRALQKANMAVKLDHVQNYEGAVDAYEDACKLLHQVLERSSGDEDKRKLESIRKTYTSRIVELQALDAEARAASGHNMTQKALPRRPMSDDSVDADFSIMSPFSPVRNPDPLEGGSGQEHDAATSYGPGPSQGAEPSSYQSILRDSTVLATAIQEVEKSYSATAKHEPLTSPWMAQLRSAEPTEPKFGIRSPMDSTYMPPPLVHKRSLTPQPDDGDDEGGDGEERRMPSPTPPQSSLAAVALAPAPSSASATAKTTGAAVTTDKASTVDHTHHRPRSSDGQGLFKEETISWLNIIDESDSSSCASSIRSPQEPPGLRRKPLHRSSGNTEADLDAAMDAAVEAAYDDGMEPDDDYDGAAYRTQTSLTRSNVGGKMELSASEQDDEREKLIEAAKMRDRENRLQGKSVAALHQNGLGLNDQVEEEEQLLDDITHEHIADGFDFDLRSKAFMPRQSDSSGFSGSTWSSVASNRTTAGTSLSTVAETKSSQSAAPVNDAHTAELPPLPPVVVGAAATHTIPAPSQPPPPPPPSLQPAAEAPATLAVTETNQSAETVPFPSSRPVSHTSVRSRRLSAINPKQLKIETSVKIPSASETRQEYHEISIPPAPHTEPLHINSKPSSDEPVPGTLLPDTVFKPNIIKNLAVPSPPATVSPADTAVSASSNANAAFPFSIEAEDIPPSPSKHVGRFGGLRKNKSSVSLKNRALSLSSPEGSDGSVNTPMSLSFSVNKKGGTPAPALPTPNLAFASDASTVLFESNIHSPDSPGSPNPLATNALIPLEACPEVFLLRPFWLMRAIYQTITHPRGGYLSTKLFVPRDVWTAKSVKLKNLDDKVAVCDLLTAALQKLAIVDTYDADAVLEEMQALELVLDQAQATLNKKVGSEVGITGMASMFREASGGSGHSAGASGDGQSIYSEASSSAKSAMSQSKLMLSSWRKLRSKNSAANTPSIIASGPGGTVANGAVFGGGGHGSGSNGGSGFASGASGQGHSGKDGSSNTKDSNALSMPTLPMSSGAMAHQQVRFARRDLAQVDFTGPNTHYMGSLARLFDAVQVLGKHFTLSILF